MSTLRTPVPPSPNQISVPFPYPRKHRPSGTFEDDLILFVSMLKDSNNDSNSTLQRLFGNVNNIFIPINICLNELFAFSGKIYGCSLS